MTSLDVPVSAPGLTQEQLRGEQDWVVEFFKATDALDWPVWEKFWSDDAFLQFGNDPKIIGKQAITNYFVGQLGVLEHMHHDFVRLSFDAPLGLIYPTVFITYRVKGDPHGRTIKLPGVGVIHKQVGSKVLTGFEIYMDKGPVVSVVQEVLQNREEAT